MWSPIVFSLMMLLALHLLTEAVGIEAGCELLPRLQFLMSKHRLSLVYAPWKISLKILLCSLLLLAGGSALAQTELIRNGGFETVGDGSWTVTTNGINQADSWYNGKTAANNVDGLLYQTVTIPPGTASATLSYYVKISTSETSNGAYDHLDVEIRNASGTLLSSLGSYSNQSASTYGTWTLQTFNLSSYAGQTIRVTFHGTTDSATITVFRIDDVSLQVIGATATAPTVQTSAVSSVTASSAQLNGSVNPNGSATTAYFEYGTTTSYGSTIGSANLGSGTSATAFQSALTGLTPSTTYHYRAVASNGGGTIRGVDMSFATSTAVQQSGSLQVTILPAGAVSAGAQWQVDSGPLQNGGVTVSSLSPGSYTVAFKPISGWTAPASQTVTVNANLTTTASGTYQVQNTTGCSQYSADFDAAGSSYGVPSNLLRAIAQVESTSCNQGALNPADGGCGVMQLTGATKTSAASLLGVTEAALCDNTSAGARLNIMGGAAVLSSKKCWSNPRVFTQADFNSCAANAANSFTQSELQQLTATLETWWWSTVAYNGGGQDGYTSTSNYPFRVWSKFASLSVTPSYPPLSEIQYLVNGSQMPDNPAKLVGFSSSEIQAGDDALYPQASQLAPGVTNGIRWVRGTFNPFVEIATHNNDGSIYGSSGTSITDPDITALTNTTQQVAWFYIYASGRWYIVSASGGLTPAVLYLKAVDANSNGGILWKPISNYGAFAGNPAAAVNFTSIAVSPDGRTIQFGPLP
jgi:hypothetical protein